MYDSVRNSFIGFTTRFEGLIPYMYLDIKGLVTIGIGNLIDPMSLALPLPFVHKSDSSTASQAQITAEWNKIKAATGLAQQGARAAAALTTLMLTTDSITALVLSKLNSNITTLKATKEFASFESWPADAQLGLLSMAWALGPAFAAHWPSFTAAAGKGDWSVAAANCQVSTTGNPGVAPRNAADVQLFTNAAAVKKAGSDPSVLWYPKSVPAAGSATTGSGVQGTQGTSGTTSPGTGTTSSQTSGSAGTSTAATGDGTETADGTDTGSADTGDGADTGSTDGTDTDGTDTGSTDTGDGTDTGSTDGTDTGSTDTGSTDGSDTGSTDGTDSTGDGGSDSVGDDSGDSGSSGDGT